jgi:hypothetical protein
MGGEIMPVHENWTIYNFKSDPKRSKRRMKMLNKIANQAKFAKGTFEE